MFYPATHHKAVSGTQLEVLASGIQLQFAGNYIDQLIVGMRVRPSHPASVHVMFDEHKFLVGGEHSPPKSRLGKGASLGSAYA